MERIKQLSAFTLSVFFLFNILYAQPGNGDIVKIKNVSASKFAAPRDASLENNAGIIISDNSSGSQFRWRVSRVYTRGTSAAYIRYAFQNVNSGMYLSVLNSSHEEGAGICQKQIPDTRFTSHPEILWKLESSSTGFKLINNLSPSQKMAVEGGSTANNAALIQWSDVGQADLNWQFQPAGSDTASATGRKVLFDVVLNYIAVAEATRNRIDNGDCKRIFGQVKTELWELDEHGEMKTRLVSYNNMSEFLYKQSNYTNPPTIAVDYYRSNLGNPVNVIDNEMGKVTYNVPLTLLQRRRVMLVVKILLGTRHKDSDLSSYDALRMQEEIVRQYPIDGYGRLSQTIQTTTAANSGSSSMMNLSDVSIPANVFGGDDTHRIWIKFITNTHD